MKGLCFRWKPQTVLKLALYSCITYFLWDMAGQRLNDRPTGSDVIERKFLPDSEGPFTTPFELVTEVSVDSEEGQGEGVNNGAAWRELVESDNYIMASQYTNIGNVLDIPALNYIENYKNPCWHEKTVENRVGTIRCLPYVFLAGK